MTHSHARCLWLLGPVRVYQGRDGDEAQNNVPELPRFRSRRTVGLLGFLTSEQRPIARELLAALFWPDEAPAQGRANLSRELHNLTQILPDCWELDRQSVAFVPPANTTVDVYRLLQLETQERWVEAAELLGGEFLEGVDLAHNPEFENWLLGERERWRGRAETVLSRVIEAHTRHGRYTDALRQAQRLLQLAPWDEAAHRHAMRLLEWTGQRGAALRQYESCRRALREELDVEPSGETADLYQRIRAGKLNQPPQLPAFLTETGPRPGLERPLFIGRERELALLDKFVGAALAGQSRAVFITGGPGRGKTALLEAFARSAMAAHPKLLVASGRCNAYSGVGDPYLPFRDVMAMLTGDVEGRWEAGAISSEHARRLWTSFPHVVQGLLDRGPEMLDVLVPGGALLSLARAGGHQDAPWFSALQEAVRHRAMDTAVADQSQLFQQVTAVLRSVAQERPLLLLLDDIQWADGASISLLFHLGRRLADAPSRILIACAYRPEEVALGPRVTSSERGERHPLAKVLSEFKRSFGDVWLDLGRTDEPEDRRFVDALLDAEPNRLGARFRAALFDRTEGHPLFTVELLRAMQERGELLKDAGGVWTEGPALNWELLPARVEAVIEERVDRLDSELQDILSIASVEGETFTANVVADVQNVPDRVVLRRLSQDLQRRHRLVREQEEIETSQSQLSRYRFGHALFQDFVYRRLGPGERRLLHGSVAATLEKLHAGQLDEMAVQLAHHYQQAGDHASAFHYFSLAGERASRVYASREAIAHYTRAIELAGTVKPAAIQRAELHRGRGLALETMAEFDQALSDYTQALQIAHAAGDHTTEQVEWRTCLDMGKLWAARDHEQARSYFETALDLARRVDEPASLAISLNWMGNWYTNSENPHRAVAHHTEALTIFEGLGDRQELANTLDLLGIANLLAGNLQTAVQHYSRAIPLCRELGDRLRLASSLVGRASAFSFLTLLTSVPAIPPRDPEIDINEAFPIARHVDSASNEIWAMWALGMMHILHGNFGDALEQLQSALGFATKLGHHEWVAATRYALGILYAELFSPQLARQQLEQGLNLAHEMRSPLWIHVISGALAWAFMTMDDEPAAQICLERVISDQAPMDTLGKRYCWVRRAELALAQSDSALALDITERLVASAASLSPGRVIPFVWKVQAEALAAQGRAEDARSRLYDAIETAHATGQRFLLWRLHASLGQLHRNVGDREAAEEEFANARAHIEQLARTVRDDGLRDEFRAGALKTFRAAIR